MYCRNCGSQVADNQRFCHNCGESVLADTLIPPTPPSRPAEQPESTAQQVVSTPISEPQQPIEAVTPQAEDEEIEVIIDDSDDEDEDDGNSTLDWIIKIVIWVAIAGGFVLLKLIAKGAIKF